MDKEFIISLYRSQYKNIVLYLTKMGATKEEAEDITQESFLKILEYIYQMKITHINSYIFKIAVNKFINSRKKDSKITFNLDENFFERIEEEEKAEDRILRKEDKKEINEVLNSLKEVYRSLLILKYDLELSNKEISNLLELESNTVKVYLYRARNLFIKEYEKRYGRL